MSNPGNRGPTGPNWSEILKFCWCWSGPRTRANWVWSVHPWSNPYFRRCEVVVDKEKPLMNPKTENEWFSLFSRRPTYVLGGGLMLVENCNITVKERKN